MRHVRDGSEFAVIAFDANHSPNSELRRISLKAEFTVLIGVLQYGHSSESSLQGLEQSFLLITEVKYNVFASQIHHGATNNSVVLNKTSIEVAEPEEGMDLLDICQLRPLQNSINLSGSILIPSRETIILRKLTSVTLKRHFSGLTNKSLSRNLLKTSSTTLSCSS